MKKERSVQLFVSSDLAFDQRVLRTAKSLVAMGCQVKLEGRRLAENRVPEIEGVEVHRSRLLFSKGPGFYLEINLRYLIIALFSRQHYFWAADLDVLPGVLLASIFRRKKLIYDAHEHYVESPELAHRPVIKWIWSALARTCIPRADLAITVNELLADRLANVYGIPFHSIRNMPRTNFVNNEVREKVIWYQGAVNQGRCLELLVDSLVYLPGFSVEIAGTGDIFEELNRRVASRSISERVIFHGRMSYDTMQKRASRCFLGFNLLEHLGENYYLSLANKFFDYVQAGLPSVNPAFPVYEKYLQEFRVGIATDVNTPEEFADIVKKLWANKADHDHFRRQCAEAAVIWNWDSEEKRLHQLLYDFFNR